MKEQEKINYLKENHFSEWRAARASADEELSQKQSMFCICGRLATGLHESRCRKFNQLVNKETVKKLSHLL